MRDDELREFFVFQLPTDALNTTTTNITTWLNENQGLLSVILFVLTLVLGWATGIIDALRRRPLLKIKVLAGPSFTCTFGTGEVHGAYDVHRTGVALYLRITNVGSAPTAIDEIAIGYHWAITPFSKLWLKYRIGRFWLREQTVIISDFQHKIGDNTKFYPFLVQQSSRTQKSSNGYLQVGQSESGVIYFEQGDSYGACFPVSKRFLVKIKIKVKDSFGKIHSKTAYIPRYTLDSAIDYNPHFGQTILTIRNEEKIYALPYDSNGNILPTTNTSPADK